MLNVPAGYVLVVDDEPIVRDFLVRSVSRAGYTCIAAENGEIARKKLAEHPIQVMTLDVNMPGQSGLDFLHTVHQDFPDVSVLMLTANGEMDTAIDTLTHGACAFLTKPIDSEQLVEQLHLGMKRCEQILDQRNRTSRLEAQIRNQTAAIDDANEETVRLLVGASLWRDEETGEHIQRVGISSSIVARAIGWCEEDVRAIRLAAPMHDVGKIGVPDGVLQKPGKLTDAEFELIKTHTTIGAKLLSVGSSPIIQMAREIAQSHHERPDGKGYPEGLVGDEIPQSAKIVAIADVFDALTHDRVYRPAMALEDALQILRDGRGSQFDAELLDVFFSVLGIILDLNEQVNDVSADRTPEPCPA